MRLIITIDTEEDVWDGYNVPDPPVTNIGRIPFLQELFDEFGARPTYLITYPVATDRKSVSILRSIRERGGCEIGSHCHPWNTPPLKGKVNNRSSMLCNLESGLQYEKMNRLHNVIKDGFGMSPVSFRCGRWGYNRDVAVNLKRLGYKVDTSVAAFVDWSVYDGPDFSKMGPGAFRFSTDNIYAEKAGGELLEVPATVGFLQKDFARSNRMLRSFTRTPLNRLRLYGLFYRLNLLNRVWLSPEYSGSRDMIRLAKNMRSNGYGIINMAFHSPNLYAGMTPFVKSADDEKAFLKKIREFLSFARDEKIEMITLSETADHI